MWLFGGRGAAAEVAVSPKVAYPTVNAAGEELPWTQEELHAFYVTRDLLLSSSGPYKLPVEKLSVRNLMLATLNCKCRPPKAAKKYSLWLKALETFGISSFDSILSEVGVTGDGGGSEEGWELLKPMLTAFAGCGLDKQNRSIMWIRARPTLIEEEQHSVRASSLYFTAIHADLTSIRQGITFVLDISSPDSLAKKIGNEDKLQRYYQSMPLRPQTIYFVGATAWKRILVNAIISLASVFTSEKVIDRVRFAELDEVKTKIDDASIPCYMGGHCQLDTNDKVWAWMRERLKSFPPLPDLFVGGATAEDVNRA